MKPQDIERYYKAHNVSESCPTCGNTRWEVAEPPIGFDWSISSAHQGGGVVAPAPSIPLLVLFCSNCFASRTHALVAVKRWLSENPLPRGPA